MNAYHNLASSYDRLTNDVDYAAIVAFYDAILQKENVQPRSAIDLACGTGSVALLLAQKYDRVIGVDMSEEMTEYTQYSVLTHGLMSRKNVRCLSAKCCSSCVCRLRWTWRFAHWTAWTISWILQIVRKLSVVSIRL